MDPNEKRYWPFDVLSPEQQTNPEQGRREIQFLETAFQAGYKPYMVWSQNFGAAAGGRIGEIICRGSRGKHWEVFLSPFGLSAHLDDFEYSAGAVLRWLQGIEAAEIVEYLRGHLVVTRVTAPGFKLHEKGGSSS